MTSGSSIVIPFPMLLTPKIRSGKGNEEEEEQKLIGWVRKTRAKSRARKPVENYVSPFPFDVFVSSSIIHTPSHIPM